MTVSFKNYNFQSDFQCGNITDPSGSFTLTDAITLPDGSAYHFTYEPTPNNPNAVTGRLASIQLPSGGTISYQYLGSHDGINCSDGSTMGLQRTTPDGTWTYVRSGSTTTVTDPKQNQTVYTFQNGVETLRQFYQGAVGGTLLKTVATCYNGNCNAAPAPPFTSVTVYTQLPSSSGITSAVNTNYNGNGLPAEVDEYDFGAVGIGTQGPLLRKTVTAYATFSNNILDHPSTVTLYDGNGNQINQTSYGYDTLGNMKTLTLSGKNATTVQRSIVYNSNGTVQSSTDFNGDSTSYTYGTGSCSGSFPTSVSEPLGLSRSMTWDCNGGVLTSATDENGQDTHLVYGDANFWRPTQVNYPDSGQTTYTYNSASSPWSIAQTSKISSTQTFSANIIFDGLARVSQHQLTSDPEGTAYTNVTYDSTGLQASISNPYRSNSDPTYGVTQYSYDALGRTTQQLQQDGSSAIQWSYSQNCTTGTDEAGKKTETCTDGLGRVTSEFEPDSTGALNWETDYVYDALNDLVSVTQKGGTTNSTQWRVRSYAYDGLGRITQAMTPESGTTNRFYTASGGGLCSGDPSLECRCTDARGLTSTYAYDALNRLTGKTYSDSTPAATYSYDQSSFNGLTITNGKGRRTGITDGSGQTAWSFDAMGRLASEQRTISGFSKKFSYSYNLDGSINTLQYPSGRTLAYAYSNAARQISTIDSADGINYAKSATYWAPGQLHTLLLGNDSGNTGTTLTQSFDSRLRPTNIQAVSPSETLLNLSYSWTANSLVQQETNNLDNSRTQSFAYDQVNRLQSAHSSSTWGDSYTYDPWSNLLQKTVTQGTGESLSVAFNAQNHISGSGFIYDAAGDMTSTGSHSYSYDAEGRQTIAGTGTYTYDGDDLRVEKVDSQTSSNDRLYWRGGSLDVLTESDSSANLQKDFIFFNGARIAFHSYTSGNHHYFYTDQLASTRVIANKSGSTIEWAADYFPWGAHPKPARKHD